MHGFVGRDRQRGRVAALLADAAAGRSGSLVLVGDPGMGKSALLEDAAASADGFTVLRADGLAPGDGVPFGALSRLLEPHLGRLEGLPGPQAAALRAALGRGGQRSDDRFAVYAGALTLLGAVGGARPLLVIVDDAHWVDAASVEALLFAARRMQADRIAMLFAVHASGVQRFLSAGLPVMWMRGLPVEQAGELLAPMGVGRPVVERLVSGTGGNPLALREITERLTPGQRRGTEPLPDPLPAVGGAAAAVHGRLQSLPPPTRHALLVVAASETGALDQVVPVLEALGLSAEDLEDAETEGMVGLGERTVRFANPVVRSAVYHGAGEDDRRAIHRAYAAMTRAVDAERLAWHLVRAADGPDEAVARALDRAVARMRERMAFLAAADAGMRAAALSVDPARAAARRADAAQDALAGGDLGRAMAIIRDLLRQDLAPAVRGALLYRRGLVQLSRGPIGRAVSAFTSASDLLACDPAAASLALTAAAQAAYLGQDVRVAMRHARHALKRAPEHRPDVRGLANMMHLACRLAAADPSWRRSAGTWDPGAIPSEYLPVVVNGMLWMGDPMRALDVLDRALDPVVRGGGVRTSVGPLTERAVVGMAVGRWDAALADADEAIRLATLTGQRALRVRALGVVTRIAAARGDERACRAAAEEALGAGRALAMITTFGEINAALGLLELGLGRPGTAVSHLHDAAGRAARLGVVHPAVMPYGADLVEALVLCGRREEAAREAVRLRRAAAATGTGVAQVMADRAWAKVVADDGVEESFSRAVAEHADAPYPFEVARLRLCFGERRLAGGRTMPAREPLEQARDAFRSLGAVTWERRAETALAATGARPGGAHDHRGVPLTHQELQVARAVADGLSNKEVAARLFLSTKTVEFHLSNAYRKLGVRSRAELARRAADRGLSALGEHRD